MPGLSCHTVVDQMLLELAERRRATSARRAAYLALARAVLLEATGDGARTLDAPDELRPAAALATVAA